MNSSNAKRGPGRLAFLDWTRGLAALVMLQGHVFHSFTDKAIRDQSPYVLSQFIGGMTPAVFLFLTGVTLAFLMDSRMRAGVPPAGRMQAAMRRAGYLGLLAVLFRLQLWWFAGGQSPWQDVFKVDILNCMSVSILLLAPLALTDTLTRVRWAAGAGLFFSLLAPVLTTSDTSSLPWLVRSYLLPDPNQFPLFPWTAFVAFGLSLGSILRLMPSDQMHRVMQWATLGGIVVIGAAVLFHSMPYSLYERSEFWLNSPLLIFIKTGLILIILSFAFLWTRYAAPTGWSALRQLGSTSLLVYWVHTEIVYGRWFGHLKERMSVAETMLAALLVIAGMVGLSTLRTRWRELPYVREWLPQPAPSPAAGD